jgi:RHS repeat-associated protein
LIHPAAELSYTRDVGNRITSVGQSSNTTAVTYDSSGRISAATHTHANHTDESYTYDGAGNRLGSHLLSGIGTVTAGNRLTAIGAFSFTHDADGNMAKRTNTATGEVTNFIYDHRNRMVSATVHPSEGAAATTTVNLSYDFADRLASREINGVKHWIIYDRQMPIAEFADGDDTISKMYFYSLDHLDDFHAVWHADGSERWFMKDHLGSVRGLLDENGALVSWVDYDAYGNILGTPPADLEPLGYAGRFYIEELGFYEFRRRYYDPLIGRFTQPDPIHLQGGDVNLYAYVRNNPMRWTDPYGTTAAIEYGDLVDMVALYVDSLCKLGNCVGNIWKGVTEGTVNLTPVDPSADLANCAISFVPNFLTFPDAANYVGGPIATGLSEFGTTPGSQSAGDAGGNILAVTGAVDSCKSLTFTVTSQ